MELSNEDNLRLNVLMHQNLQAIRIDESKMLVYALTEKGEAKVVLKPNCRDEKYLRLVREMFSTHALGSPGGYPVYLRRWTRMGEMREGSLQGLLLLGESEAVVAVANSPELSEEIAKRVWWAMPDADIARRMLRQPKIKGSEIGKELAAYLVDYLPFESEANNIVESVRLVLQPGLVDELTINSLWSRAGRKSAYYIGFLLATPNDLPEQAPENPLYQTIQNELVSESDNIFARLIVRLLSPEGQSFLNTLLNTMDRLSDQHVTVLFLKAVQNYFKVLLVDSQAEQRDFANIEETVNQMMKESSSDDLKQVVAKGENYKSWVESMLTLSLVGESLVDPIFSQTDAVGSVMRRRLQPVTEPIMSHIQRFLSH
jgi:hypothetical protein